MNISGVFQAIVTIVFLLTSCSPSNADVPNDDYENNVEIPDVEEEEVPEEDEYPVSYPDPTTPKVKTLQVDGYFQETKIKDGITLYSVEKKKDVEVTNAVQTVFALEIDLNNEAYKVDFHFNKSDSTSALAKRFQAIAAVNACYELDAIYCKTNNVVRGTCTLDPDHLRFWKHEAAIVGDGKRKVGMVYGAKGTTTRKEGGIQALEIYKSLEENNIFASAPMLIDDYEPVGASYVPSTYTSSMLSQFDGEDWRRHQGVRHPRVAAALTEDNDLLLVVVDGRFSGKASGMTAKELTEFLARYFNPRWAINMDGGGSATMYIEGHGDPVNNVLNYPTDNGKWDHYGQRKRQAVFLIRYDK